MGYFVYRLNATNSERFYIGKSKNPSERLKQHLRKARNTTKRSVVLDWIRSHGPENISVFLLAGPYDSEIDAYECEKHLIAEARERGFTLVNDPRTTGGENPPNHLGMKRRPETLERLKIAVKAAMQRPEVRNRVSNGQRGRKHNPESVEKMKATLTGRKHSPKSCENMRQAQLRRYARERANREI